MTLCAPDPLGPELTPEVPRGDQRPKVFWAPTCPAHTGGWGWDIWAFGLWGRDGAKDSMMRVKGCVASAGFQSWPVTLGVPEARGCLCEGQGASGLRPEASAASPRPRQPAPQAACGFSGWEWLVARAALPWGRSTSVNTVCLQTSC